jgi:Leucine-rich repeat (LRR) protein
LSFNLIREIEGIATLVNLESLYFVQNKISEIKDLGALTKLKSLELGANRIRIIENLDHLLCLEEIFLGKNKISRMLVHPSPFRRQSHSLNIGIHFSLIVLHSFSLTDLPLLIVVHFLLKNDSLLFKSFLFFFA